MVWKQRLEKLGTELADKRRLLQEEQEVAAEKEARQRPIYRIVAWMLLDDLQVVESLAGIRDEFWEVGEIRHNIAPGGFVAELCAEYPQYLRGNWPSEEGHTVNEADLIPASIDFVPEFLKLELHIHEGKGLATLIVSWLHADNQLLLMRIAEFRQKYGWQYSNRFLDLRGRWRIYELKPRDNLSMCRARIEEVLLDYCAVRAFLPRWAILATKSEEILRALRGELPLINVNEEALTLLRNERLLMD